MTAISPSPSTFATDTTTLPQLVLRATARHTGPATRVRRHWVHGLGGRSAEDRPERLFGQVDELLATVGMPGSLAELGISRADFEAALPELADAAFADPSLRTNPRMPLLSELLALLEAGWSGQG